MSATDDNDEAQRTKKKGKVLAFKILWWGGTSSAESLNALRTFFLGGIRVRDFFVGRGSESSLGFSAAGEGEHLLFLRAPEEEAAGGVCDP